MDLDDDNDDNYFFGGTKTLRKSMFVCQHERDEHVRIVKMNSLKWAKRHCRMFRNDDYIGVPIIGMMNYHNVLSNADILEHVVMHLTDKDLLSNRLVCKYWSTEMAYFLSKRKSLVVAEGHNSNAESLIKKRLEGEPVALSKLSLFDINPTGPMYKKLFRVFGCAISSVNLEGCHLSPTDLRQILVVDAPNIENFSLREEFPLELTTKKSKVNTFKHIKKFNNGNLCLPQMKLLHWDEQNGRVDLKDFIEACPNLVSLELRNFPRPRSELYKALSWKSLRTLFLSPENVLDIEHCKALTYLNLQLKNLTLFGLNSHDHKSMICLSKFLSSVGGNLQILELWLDYGSLISNGRAEHYSPLTAALPNVTRLHTEIEILGHVNNLRRFPALVELEVVSNHQEMQNWTVLTKRTFASTTSNNLRSFRCGDIDCKSLEKVMKVFPFLTSLNIYASCADDKLLRCVFTNLPLLLEFTISPCMKTHLLPVTDSGFTGIKTENCIMLGKNLRNFDDSVVQKLRCLPDIGKLKSLQKLDLSFSVSSMITDVAVFFGISTLTNLTVLKFPACEITDASLSVIDNTLAKLVILGIGGCKQITPKAVGDLKRDRGGMLIDAQLPEIFERPRNNIIF